MISKNLKFGDDIAIGYRKHNTFLGFDNNIMTTDRAMIGPNPIFWSYYPVEELNAFNSIECQEELYKKYGVDIIEVYKSLHTSSLERETEYMMVQQYVLNPHKRNLGIIEFIPIKHSEF